MEYRIEEFAIKVIQKEKVVRENWNAGRVIEMIKEEKNTLMMWYV